MAFKNNNYDLIATNVNRKKLNKHKFQEQKNKKLIFG